MPQSQDAAYKRGFAVLKRIKKLKPKVLVRHRFGPETNIDVNFTSLNISTASHVCPNLKNGEGGLK